MTAGGKTGTEMDNTRAELFTEELENVLALPPGTVLDGRYRVVRVIRQGGFGITYEAVHMQSGGKVAVKEYFCREICVRRWQDAGKAAGVESAPDAGAAYSVTVADPADLPRFEADRARFLREARILREFAQEPPVVTVLDYFEEKGTAYIVMEYLDARTLREEIMDGGTWSMEKVVRRFGPVMEVLARIHAAGVLHRDISPGNLMVLPDGTLKLIDFGAARELESVDRTHSAIYTRGYSAPEQRDEKGVLGSWTDVYGLCSLFWFCLTGRDPEDAQARLIYDELEQPSALGAEISSRAEKVLLSGMALACDNRIPDMRMLREELEKLYPRVSEAEKQRKEEQRRKLIRIGCIAAAVLFVCLTVFIAVFHTQILFHFIDTQVAVLDGRHMTPEDYAVSARVARERVEALAGKGNYLWEEKEGQKIRFEVPAKVFGSSDPERYIMVTIASRQEMRIHVEEYRGAADHVGEESNTVHPEGEQGGGEENKSEVVLLEDPDAPYLNENGGKKEGYYRLGVFAQDREVENAEFTDSGVRVTFTEEARKRFKGTLDEPGRKILITFDEKNDYYLFCQGHTEGNGKSILIGPADPEKASEVPVIPDWLEYKRYTEAPLPASFGLDCVWKVRWEQPETALLPGTGQKNAEEIGDSYIDLSYSALGSYTTIQKPQIQSGYDVKMIGAQTLMKNRLDGLGLPYAIGIKEFSPAEIVVRISLENLCREELEWLGERMTFQIGDEKAIADCSLTGSVLRVKERGKGHVSLDLEMDGYTLTSVRDMLNKLEARGEKKVYLYVMKEIVACADLGDARKSMEEEACISFVRGTFQEESFMDENDLPLLRFFSVCNEQNLDENFPLRDSQVTDAGQILFFQDGLPAYSYSEPGPQWAEKWNRQHDQSAFSVEYDKRYKQVGVYAYECSLDDPAACMEAFRDIIEDAEAARVPMQEAHVAFTEEEEKERSFEKHRTIYVGVSLDFETGGKKISWAFLANFDGEDEKTIQSMCEKYNRYVQEDPYWQKTLTGTDGENPFKKSAY